MKTKLNDRAIETLEPTSSNYIAWDEALPGFGIRVTRNGAKTFLIDYRNGFGEQRRVRIGSFPTWRYDAAKREAQRLKRDIDLGSDPLADKRASKGAPTFADAVSYFETQHMPTLSPSSRLTYARCIKSRLLPALGDKKLQAISPANVRAFHAEVTARGTPTQANMCNRIASSIFEFAKHAGMIDTNPARGNVRSNREHARQRYLDSAELHRLSEALAELATREPHLAALFRLLLLCGSRRGETLAMKWADIDFERKQWSKRPETTKGKRVHIVPLSAAALEILASLPRTSEYVFPSADDRTRPLDWQVAQRRWNWIRERALLLDVTTHDLRHTAASLLISSGAGLATIQRVLGHRSARTSERYAHLSDDPVRSAIDKLGETLSGDKRGEVVMFKR